MTDQTPADPNPAPRLSASAGPRWPAFVPAVLMLVAMPVCLFFQAVDIWAQSDSCYGASGCYSPGITVVAPLPCLLVATFAAFLAPLPPKGSTTRAVFTSLAAVLGLVALVTFGIDISWGPA